MEVFGQANIIRIPAQLEFFRQYQLRVSAIIGEAAAQQLVHSALVLITLGGNDFVNNYFLTPINFRRLQYNIQDFSQFLVSEYKKVLMVRLPSLSFPLLLLFSMLVYLLLISQ